MGREYDDGVPIRRRSRPSKPVGMIAGLVAVFLLTAGIITFIVFKLNRDDQAKSGGTSKGDFNALAPPILNADSWTIRDIVTHANRGKKDGPYKLVVMHGSTFITDADDDTVHLRTYTNRVVVDNDEQFVEVTRYDTKEMARQETGDREAKRYWCWNRFMFDAPDADRGVSGRLKQMLGGE